MKVLLNADLSNLGRKGDLVEVAGGYARNYLLPKNLAILATKNVAKQAEAMQRSRTERDRREKGEFEELAARMGAQPVTFKAKAGPEGTLFGSVTASDIADRLGKLLSIEVDRRKIAIPHPIKSVGTHSFTVSLHPEVVATATIEVVSDGTGKGKAPAAEASAKKETGEPEAAVREASAAKDAVETEAADPVAPEPKAAAPAIAEGQPETEISASKEAGAEA